MKFLVVFVVLAVAAATAAPADEAARDKRGLLIGGPALVAAGPLPAITVHGAPRLVAANPWALNPGLVAINGGLVANPWALNHGLVANPWALNHGLIAHPWGLGPQKVIVG